MFTKFCEAAGFRVDETFCLEHIGLYACALHTQPKDHVLPTWNEFTSKARDYNVVIE
jgi:hypothetical protein